MKKIMIVDDEAVIALRLQQRLSEMGYEVIGISHSGEESLEKARSLRPDLILMDIMIPGGLDGITVAEIVKTELDIPVVFLTAFKELVSLLLELITIDFLYKMTGQPFFITNSILSMNNPSSNFT